MKVVLALVFALAAASASAQPVTPPDPELAALEAKAEALKKSIDEASPVLEQIGATFRRLCTATAPPAADAQRTCREQHFRAMMQFGGRPADDVRDACLRESTSYAADFVDAATGRRLPITDFVAALACDTARR